MARSLLSQKLVSVIAAVLLGSAGGAIIYLAVEWGSPTPLRGDFVNLNLTSVSGRDGTGRIFTNPVVSASIMLTSPPTLDPTGVVITITGPNSTLMIYNGSQEVSVHQIVEVWIPDTYPHWSVVFPMGPAGAYRYWSGYAVTFVNPDGATVGSMTPGVPSAALIASGATMWVWFPNGAAFPTTASGYTIMLTDLGHPGAISLSVP